MLVGLGVKKGSRILYLVPNIPESGQRKYKIGRRNCLQTNYC